MLKKTLALLVLALGACSSEPSRTSVMEMRLVDAPGDVKSIVVTLFKIEAHTAGGGWETLLTKAETVDLMQLQGGTFATLGLTTLPAGHITQLRLFVDDAGPNFVITLDGVQHPLTVPSGDESGIKIIGGFDLEPCATGSVTLDFDGHNSIFTHPTGSGDEWILRPVIRLKSVVHGPGTCVVDAGPPPSVPDAAPTPTPPPPAPAPISPPPSDVCGSMNCADGQYCNNGVCQAIIP
jgi:uncharacterized protein DUF4382